MKDGIDPSEIQLPFPEPPEPGRTVEIAPGLLWARMPLPFRLNHVNVWLLAEDDGWTAVDCGPDTPEVRAAWDDLVSGTLRGSTIRQLVATHGHVDHVGLSGWLTSRFPAPLHATLGAWLWARLMSETGEKPVSPTVLRHMEVHGCDPKDIAAFAKNRGMPAKLFGPQPAAFVRLRDGKQASMAGRQWRIDICEGHGDEHASFYCERNSVLIAGDQILQRISPVVGVFAGEPMADPLSDYLDSLELYRGLPSNTLVLPSHGLPFYGLHTRLDQLARHHRERLGETLTALDRPRTAMEAARVLFGRAVAEGQWFLALAETLAHLHRLENEDRVGRQVETSGLIRFARK
jgi:glyoxylase-like metal-dependent hydrolase (beta-lactamase superfamily II)